MLRSANLPNFLSWISKSVKLGGEMSRVLGMNETVSPGIRKLVVSWKVSMRMLTFPSVPTIRHTHKYSSQHDMFKIEENMPAELKFRTSSSDTLLGIEG